MPVTNTTANRGYQLPNEVNNLADDVARIIAALSAIDIDIANTLADVAGRALAEHAHTIADTTGLAAALTAREETANKGAANGYAGLDGTGKVPTAQLPASVLGAVNYVGGWNAATNSPTMAQAIEANKGFYFKVTTAGATSIDGETDWKVGDWIISSGTIWEKVDNTDQVTSVAGRGGAVIVTKADVGLSNASDLAPADYPISTAQAAALAGKEPANAQIVKGDTPHVITAGYVATAENLGTVSTGTVTPTPVTGNLKRMVNGGAHTLAAPTVGGDYTIVMQYTNGAAAGALSLTGFNKVTGDAYTVTNGHDFLIFITRVNGFRHAHIQALQ